MLWVGFRWINDAISVESCSVTNTLGPEGVRYTEMFVILKPVGNNIKILRGKLSFFLVIIARATISFVAFAILRCLL